MRADAKSALTRVCVQRRFRVPMKLTRLRFLWQLLGWVTLFALVTPLQAQIQSVKPEVWMMPPGVADGRCLRQLFTQPDQWVETRSLVQVLGYADHQLNRQFKDEELRAWLPMIERWGLKLGLEVGAVKPWGTTGEKTFEVERTLWDRFQSLGGRIYALAMDGPLCCVRKDLKKQDEYAVKETAQFIALVRQRYPGVQVGDIEPYPFLQLKDLISWIDALQARLKQMNVRGLDFFRLDVDWNHFTIGNRIYPGNWPQVKELEIACRQRKLPFSLIYWAADYHKLDTLKLADDATWYIGIMRQGHDYAFVGDPRTSSSLKAGWAHPPSPCRKRRNGPLRVPCGISASGL